MVDQPVNDNEQHNSRLQLLAQAIEKVESECSLKRLESTGQNNNSNTMAPVQSPEFLMQLLTQQNVAAVMAAAAAAAAAAQLQQQQHQQHQHQHQQHKPEPISPPSTSSASSSVESPLDFSSRRSTDDLNECSSPISPNPMLSTMFPLLLTNKNGKPTRPFKAYPRDPLMLPLGFCSGTSDQNQFLAETAARLSSNRKRFAQNSEQKTKQQTPTPNNTHFISSTGTQILQPPKKRHRTLTNDEMVSSPNAPKDSNQSETNNMVKDDAYWERRRKNNEAAKRSRDARRVKEDEIAIRAALLEQENMKLRLELSQLKQETAKLRCMIHTNS